VEWLKQFIQGGTDPINNSKLTCQHDRLDPVKVFYSKKISRVRILNFPPSKPEKRYEALH
jgi:hypothetical protein